jgi:hypothetical protein
MKQSVPATITDGFQIGHTSHFRTIDNCIYKDLGWMIPMGFNVVQNQLGGDINLSLVRHKTFLYANGGLN